MSKAFLIDIARCSGCHNCQIACKDEHVGNDWSPIAKPQPIVGQFWMKVIETVHGTIRRSRSIILPRSATIATIPHAYQRAMSELFISARTDL